MRLLFSVLLIAMISVSAWASGPRAFPGAEGFGSSTPGGRGGKVIEVTNLNDSGPGSLREACEAEGRRIVVFRVGGTISLQTSLTIAKPYITIAGQTAPGGGILLRDAGIRIYAHDVIMRCIRVRVGERRFKAKTEEDCINLGGGDSPNRVSRVIIDHCSFSWAIDENADSYSRASDFTFSWCIFSECLHDSIREKGPHSMGMLLGPDTTRTSIHHCLFAHNDQRNPRIKAGRRDLVNNVIYGWFSHAVGLSDDPEMNFVGNYLKPDASSKYDRGVIVRAGTGEMGTIYLSDNQFRGKPFGWEMVEPDTGAKQAARRLFALPITTWPADEAYERVLARAGCTAPMRDAVDKRVIRDVKQGTGRIVNNPEEVGGYPEIATGEPISDRDHDGMPDQWELSHSLDPDNPTDSTSDRDGDGYTNVEEYINGLVPVSRSDADTI